MGLPPRSPILNAYAGRFVLSIKSEYLDRTHMGCIIIRIQSPTAGEVNNQALYPTVLVG